MPLAFLFFRFWTSQSAPQLDANSIRRVGPRRGKNFFLRIFHAIRRPPVVKGFALETNLVHSDFLFSFFCYTFLMSQKNGPDGGGKGGVPQEIFEKLPDGPGEKKIKLLH